MIVSGTRGRRVRGGAMGAIVLAAALSGCGDDGGRSDGDADGAPALCTGGFHVCGGFLRDESGRAVILRGANLAGAHKNPPYFSFHDSADFARMRDDWGFNAVRFLISWAAVEPSEGVYDDAYLDDVAERMQWASDAGLLVVLDMHQDVYGEGFVTGGGNGAPRWTCDEARYEAFVPASSWFLNYGDENVIACYDHLWTDDATRAHLVEAWRRVAERLADEPAIVGFDVYNEPHWGSHGVYDFEIEVLQPFYEEVVAQVRTEAPHWVAFLEPASSRNLGFFTSLQPFEFADVVYAPHAYDTGAEQGMGYSEERRQAYLDNVVLLADEARQLGAALWIGEYGGFGEGLREYMDAAFDAAGAVAAGNMLWSYDSGGSYSILLADGSENEALTASVVRPFPMRVAGDPLGWEYDEPNGVLTIRIRPDARVAAATEISLPPRLFPDGADVECGGCGVEVSGGVARLSELPAQEIVTIVVTPR